MTITGTVAQINAFLGGASTSTLTYTNTRHAVGQHHPDPAVNDNGNTGGGALTATTPPPSTSPPSTTRRAP